jgi:hypothetical protein
MKRNTSTTWTDLNGNKWDVNAEFKEIDGHVGIASISVKPINDGYYVTRTVLAQLPLLELFGDLMFQKRLDFTRWQRIKRNTANHKGQASSDEELKLIAEVREAALKANFPVHEAVAKVLGITRGAAGNRIKAARARGFVPPSRQSVK